jgi:hypothetical protein
MFEGRNLLIVTKHEKEKVIAPILEKELGVRCFLTNNFDTDELGTFSGEIERKGDPVSTVREKCLRAMQQVNCDLAVASEGSFGPHPTIFFAPADDEFLLFLDKRNDLEIIVRELSLETNFAGSEIGTEIELNEFAENALFPSHALIVRKSQKDFSTIIKGITNSTVLKAAFDELITEYGTAFVETDMRAMYNPTRMKVIEKAAIKLAQKIKSLCPNCKTPGFGITKVSDGLPCEVCCFPTRSTLSYISTCKKCNHTKEERYPNGKTTEKPMYCDYCNP